MIQQKGEECCLGAYSVSGCNSSPGGHVPLSRTGSSRKIGRPPPTKGHKTSRLWGFRLRRGANGYYDKSSKGVTSATPAMVNARWLCTSLHKYRVLRKGPFSKVRPSGKENNAPIGRSSR